MRVDNSTDSMTAGGAPFLAVHPHVLVPATFPPFPLHVRGEPGGTATLFRKAGEAVYANTWDKARQGGHEFLYVPAEDADACFDYVEANLSSILAEDAVPAAHVAEWLYRLACRAMAALLAAPESLRDYSRVKALVEAAASLVRRHEGVEWRMMDSAPLTYSTPAHCVNVSTLLTSFAVRVLEVEDEQLLREVALGGALHDLGKAMIPAHILAKRAPLTRREFAHVRKHPLYGIKMTQPYLHHTFIAQCIIGQHHENASGDGYPDGRSAESINTFARAAHIADVFDALTSERPYGPALDDYRALNTMVTEMRSQFDLPMLRKFIRHLAASREEPAVTVVADQAPVERTAEPVPSLAEEPVPSAAEGPVASAAEGPVATGDEPAETAEETQVLLLPDEPAAEPEPLAHIASADQTAVEPEVTLYATLQERLDAIRAISGEHARDAAFMTGLLRALKGAFEGPLGQAARAAAPAPAAAPPEDPAGQVEVAMVRGLFPIVWQVDEWVERFSASPHLTPDGMWLRADTLSCLRALRQGIIQVLQAHNVEVVEDVEALVPVDAAAAQDTPDAAALPAEGLRAPAEAPREAAPRRVRRVGFLYRAGQSARVIEPARIVLYADLRKAG